MAHLQSLADSRIPHSGPIEKKKCRCYNSSIHRDAGHGAAAIKKI
jgi:hypothetical protein